MAQQEDEFLRRLLGNDLLKGLDTLPDAPASHTVEEEDFIREQSTLERAGAVGVIIDRRLPIGEQKSKIKEYGIKTFDGRVQMKFVVDAVFNRLSFDISRNYNFSNDFDWLAFNRIPGLIFPEDEVPDARDLKNLATANLVFQSAEDNNGTKSLSVPLGQPMRVAEYTQTFQDPGKLFSASVDVHNQSDKQGFRYEVYMQNALVLSRNSNARFRLSLPPTQDWNEQAIAWMIDNHQRGPFEEGRLEPIQHDILTAVTQSINALGKR